MAALIITDKNFQLEITLLAGDGKGYNQRIVKAKYKGVPKLKENGTIIQTEKAILGVFKGESHGVEYHFEKWLQKSTGVIDTQYGFGGVWKFTDASKIFDSYTKNFIA